MGCGAVLCFAVRATAWCHIYFLGFWQIYFSKMQVDQKLIKRDGKLTWAEKCRRKKDQVCGIADKQTSKNSPKPDTKTSPRVTTTTVFGKRPFLDLSCTSFFD